MYPRAASVDNTNANTTPCTVPATASATSTSNHQHAYDNAPVLSETKPDFYLDTFFSPVWMSGPHVFSFAANGTVVRPKTYAPEPYPGYRADADRPPRFDPDSASESVDASHFQGFAKTDVKPWKNVAITEQDDAEFEAFLEQVRVGALGEWGGRSLYGGPGEPSQQSQEPEPVYTWPPTPGAW